MILASLVPYTLTYAVAIFMEDTEHMSIDSFISIMAYVHKTPRVDSQSRPPSPKLVAPDARINPLCRVLLPSGCNFVRKRMAWCFQMFRCPFGLCLRCKSPSETLTCTIAPLFSDKCGINTSSSSSGCGNGSGSGSPQSTAISPQPVVGSSSGSQQQQRQ